MADSASGTAVIAGIALGLVGGTVGIIVLLWWLSQYAVEYYRQYRDRDKHETGSTVLEASDLAIIRQRQQTVKLQREREKTRKPVYRPAGENGIIALAGDERQPSSAASPSSVEGGSGRAVRKGSGDNNKKKNRAGSPPTTVLAAGNFNNLSDDVALAAETSTVASPQPNNNAAMATNDPLAWFQRMLPLGNFNRNNTTQQDADNNSNRDSLLPPPRPAYNELSVEALKRFGLDVSAERLPRSFTTAPDGPDKDNVEPTNHRANELTTEGESLRPGGSTIRMMADADSTPAGSPSPSPAHLGNTTRVLGATQRGTAGSPSHQYPPMAIYSAADESIEQAASMDSAASPVTSFTPPAVSKPTASTPNITPPPPTITTTPTISSTLAPIPLRLPLRAYTQAIHPADAQRPISPTSPTSPTSEDTDTLSRRATTDTVPSSISVSTTTPRVATVYRQVEPTEVDVFPYRPIDPSAAILSRSNLTKTSPYSVVSNVPSAYTTSVPLQRTASLMKQPSPTSQPSIVFVPRDTLTPTPPTPTKTALLVSQAQQNLELLLDEDLPVPDTMTAKSSGAWSWVPSVRATVYKVKTQKAERRVVVPPMQKKVEEIVQGLIGIATGFRKGEAEGEVDLFPGNTVVVFEAFEDGMGYGVNKTTMSAGRIPLRMITFATSEEFPDGIFVPLNMADVVTWKERRTFTKP